MDIKIKGFFVPHNGESHYSCADSIAVCSHNYAMAVADGVGGSFDPRFLSRQLTEDFVSNPSGLFDTTSFGLNKDYRPLFENYCLKRYDTLSEIEKMCWDLQKENKGISSECTFVGCVLDNNKWRYYALGDSYLFFVDKAGKLTKISSMNGREFDVHPEYFSTTGRHKGRFITGTIPLEEGVLLMMTDALSEWFSKYYEKAPSILNRILNINDHREYKELCEQELMANRMHDDDCALLLARITNTESRELLFETSHIDTFENISVATIEQQGMQIMSLREQIKTLQKGTPNFRQQPNTLEEKPESVNDTPKDQDELETSQDQKIKAPNDENDSGDTLSEKESIGGKPEKNESEPTEEIMIRQVEKGDEENQREEAKDSKKKMSLIHDIALIIIAIELGIIIINIF